MRKIPLLNVLNLGCGESPLKNNSERHYLNMDILKVKKEWNEPGSKIAYIRHNILKFPWPIDGEFDEIYMFHTIEHIPENYHGAVMTEMRRLLKTGGKLAISYPEFSKIAMNYINNVGNDRRFWRLTIYGRGQSEWDRHKALMDTPVFAEFMHAYGLHLKKTYPEPKQKFNTVCIFEKGELGLTYEGIMQKEFIK
jgi:predicted SAM-dependent methyltransferase